MPGSRARAAPGAHPGEHPFHRRCQARRHRQHRRPPGRGPVRCSRRRRGHCQSRTSAARRIAPLLERADRFVYVLCRTSNPGAAEIQDLARRRRAAVRPRRAARLASGRRRRPTVGLVVGATAPAELATHPRGRARPAVPGARRRRPGRRRRGGAPARPGHGWRRAAVRRGGGLLVNVSRGIASAAARSPTDPGAPLCSAGRRHWADVLRC